MGHIGDGRKGEDLEAPRYVFGGYEPCNKCKEKMALGTTIMQASLEPVFKGQPEMQKGVYPTGKWVVLKKEAAKRIFNTDSPKAFVDTQTWRALGFDGGNDNEN